MNNDIRMNEKSHCSEKNTLTMQRRYSELLKHLIDEKIININLKSIKVEEMACDDFKHGLSNLRTMLKLDLVKKRKAFLVKEADDNLTVYRKTDALLNEFKKNLLFLKKVEDLISQHITFIKNGGQK